MPRCTRCNRSLVSAAIGCSVCESAVCHACELGCEHIEHHAPVSPHTHKAWPWQRCLVCYQLCFDLARHVIVCVARKVHPLTLQPSVRLPSQSIRSHGSSADWLQHTDVVHPLCELFVLTEPRGAMSWIVLHDASLVAPDAVIESEAAGAVACLRVVWTANSVELSIKIAKNHPAWEYELGSVQDTTDAKQSARRVLPVRAGVQMLGRFSAVGPEARLIIRRHSQPIAALLKMETKLQPLVAMARDHRIICHASYKKDTVQVMPQTLLTLADVNVFRNKKGAWWCSKPCLRYVTGSKQQKVQLSLYAYNGQNTLAATTQNTLEINAVSSYCARGLKWTPSVETDPCKFHGKIETGPLVGFYMVIGLDLSVPERIQYVCPMEHTHTSPEALLQSCFPGTQIDVQALVDYAGTSLQSAVAAFIASRQTTYSLLVKRGHYQEVSGTLHDQGVRVLAARPHGCTRPMTMVLVEGKSHAVSFIVAASFYALCQTHSDASFVDVSFNALYHTLWGYDYSA